jgi:uncharacterized protein (UPF0297 family)
MSKMTRTSQIREGTYEGIPYTFYNTGNPFNQIAFIAPGMGGTRNDEERRTVAEALLERKVSSLCFDIQDGQTAPTVEEIVNRYQAMDEFAREKSYSPGTLVFGTSLSGLPAAVAASKIGADELRLKSPLVYFAEMLEKKLGREGLAAWRERGYIEKDGNKLPWELYRQWASVDVEEVAQTLADNGTNVRIVQGSGDEMVPPHYTQRFYNLLREKGANADLRVIEHADHEYTDPAHRAEALGYLVGGNE